MNSDIDEIPGLSGPRLRTFSNASQKSHQSSKKMFPLVTSDSGLYTCSSNTSDCSLQLESDTDSSHLAHKIRDTKDERLRLALEDVRKLRSELERLTKSEQWYKQELRQQKTTRLDDLERIYTQERNFMQENQRLQKECVRLYEKCNELERELEKQSNESQEYHTLHINEEGTLEENMHEFENEQHLALIKDQQQLISVLRKQKRSLLEELKCLSEEKDEQVMELQRLLADLEFDNKLITKKCSEFAKERLNFESNLKERDKKFSMVQQENMNLQKSIVDLKDQVEIQKQLLNLKESEIEHIEHHYTHKIQQEEDVDQVHELSMKYQEQIHAKTLDIINLKQRLQEMQDELEDIKNLQQQNEEQQRQIDQLNFSLEAHRLELQELKISEKQKNKQLDELNVAIDSVIKDKELALKTNVEQQKVISRVKQDLRNTQEQYENVQEQYKKTQFELELLQVEEKKLKFQNVKDVQEIEHLRNKLKTYLQQTAELSNKIQYLENELAKALKVILLLKQDSKQMAEFLPDLEENIVQEKSLKQLRKGDDKDTTKNGVPLEVSCHEEGFLPNHESEPYDQDFVELQVKCEKLQKNIDSITGNMTLENDQEQKILNDMNDIANAQNDDKQVFVNINRGESLEKDIDFINLSFQGNKLQENIDKLNDCLREKQCLRKDANDSVEILVTENEILKKKLYALETEALTLQIKGDINESSQKCTQLKENHKNHVEKIADLQGKLLANDSKLYKLERNLKAANDDEKLIELQNENAKLKKYLSQEQASRAELCERLTNETAKIKELQQSLEVLNEKKCEIKELKQHVLQLEQNQQLFQEQNERKKEDRIRLLREIMDVQNNKIENLQQHQKDWEDILTSLNNAHSLEEKMRQELELKRMELEELNRVFDEQNDELRKLEEFTALLEITRQKEKEQLKLTFQKEINVMKQHLQDCQKEMEQQKLLNQELEKRSNKFQQDFSEDFATEVAGYKYEIRELKSRISRIIEEKQELVEHLRELENQATILKDNKREAIVMPDFNMVTVKDISSQTAPENMDVLKQNISEDHLRVLTKVLEAEYQRKMLRYDEHIHSLLSNLKSLKKSLKANEEKTALLSEEQIKTKEHLKDLQNTKLNLEEMRLKYEQSQSVIKELKNTLAFERNKFELSDVGKSSQNNSTTYEVSNLIDDYKKLIQQSALATKRPSTSAIMDLIQRSNQCVPNIKNLETNFEGLQSELQKFLTSYIHKIPSVSLIPAASLSVPPSLMDELRAASEGF